VTSTSSELSMKSPKGGSSSSWMSMKSSRQPQERESITLRSPKDGSSTSAMTLSLRLREKPRPKIQPGVTLTRHALLREKRLAKDRELMRSRPNPDKDAEFRVSMSTRMVSKEQLAQGAGKRYWPEWMSVTGFGRDRTVSVPETMMGDLEDFVEGGGGNLGRM